VKGVFVTGTDTGVGKTLCAAGLLLAYERQGYSTIAMKPIASGCEQTAQGLRNEDALLLMQHMSVKAPYDEVNPYAFLPPMAPHLAAAKEGILIESDTVVEQAKLLAAQADTIVIEGAGGWLAPLNDQQSFADLAVELDLPVVLVVGIRLGCLNHALLTYENIRQRGVPLAGWIANTGLDDAQGCLDIEENIATLSSRISSPLLGKIPFLKDQDISTIASLLKI